MVVSHVAPTGDLACNRGMCPDWESNWGPFGSQLALNPLSYTAQSRLEFKEALPSDDLSFIMLRPSSSMLKEKRLPKKLAVCAHGGGSNQVFKGTWG